MAEDHQSPKDTVFRQRALPPGCFCTAPQESPWMLAKTAIPAAAAFTPLPRHPPPCPQFIGHQHIRSLGPDGNRVPSTFGVTVQYIGTGTAVGLGLQARLLRSHLRSSTMATVWRGQLPGFPQDSWRAISRIKVGLYRSRGANQQGGLKPAFTILRGRENRRCCLPPPRSLMLSCPRSDSLGRPCLHTAADYPTRDTPGQSQEPCTSLSSTM